MYKILPITVSDYVCMHIFTECWETIPDQMTQIHIITKRFCWPVCLRLPTPARIDRFSPRLNRFFQTKTTNQRHKQMQIQPTNKGSLRCSTIDDSHDE